MNSYFDSLFLILHEIDAVLSVPRTVTPLLVAYRSDLRFGCLHLLDGSDTLHNFLDSTSAGLFFGLAVLISILKKHLKSLHRRSSRGLSATQFSRIAVAIPRVDLVSVHRSGNGPGRQHLLSASNRSRLPIYRRACRSQRCTSYAHF